MLNEMHNVLDAMRGCLAFNSTSVITWYYSFIPCLYFILRQWRNEGRREGRPPANAAQGRDPKNRNLG